ncbi:MAG TPA: NDMA-dependent alcohol dehydrogenase [Solirubrobacteraceae bacterium]|nr:NDMA-dependent alcohol dehydrogenase [Solirubrobacteraceae bacterium]
MKTRGAVLLEVGGDWTTEDIELDPPKRGEVLVRMVASGLCHSDLHYQTPGFDIPVPLVGGHEGAGVVEEIGEGVEGLAIGDHVITTFMPSCGHCPACVDGLGQLCDRGALMTSGFALDQTTRVRVNGTPAMAMTWTGTFAEYSVSPVDSLIKIDKEVPLDKVVLISCGVPTGWGSAVNIAEVKPGHTVVVIGAGGVGMNAVQGAAFSGASQIIVVEPHQWKRDAAISTFGATHGVASLQDALPLVTELTHGRMADSAIIHVGQVQGEMIQPSLDLVKKAGTLAISAVGRMDQIDATLNVFMFAMMQKTIRGALYGGTPPKQSIPQLVELYKRGQLKLDELITNTYAVDDVNEAYQDLEAGKNLRGVVLHGDLAKNATAGASRAAVTA